MTARVYLSVFGAGDKRGPPGLLGKDGTGCIRKVLASRSN